MAQYNPDHPPSLHLRHWRWKWATPFSGSFACQPATTPGQDVDYRHFTGARRGVNAGSTFTYRSAFDQILYPGDNDPQADDPFHTNSQYIQAPLTGLLPPRRWDGLLDTPFIPPAFTGLRMCTPTQAPFAAWGGYASDGIPCRRYELGGSFNLWSELAARGEVPEDGAPQASQEYSADPADRYSKDQWSTTDDGDSATLRSQVITPYDLQAVWIEAAYRGYDAGFQAWRGPSNAEFLSNCAAYGYDPGRSGPGAVDYPDWRSCRIISDPAERWKFVLSWCPNAIARARVPIASLPATIYDVLDGVTIGHLAGLDDGIGFGLYAEGTPGPIFGGDEDGWSKLDLGYDPVELTCPATTVVVNSGVTELRLIAPLSDGFDFNGNGMFYNGIDVEVWVYPAGLGKDEGNDPVQTSPGTAAEIVVSFNFADPYVENGSTVVKVESLGLQVLWVTATGATPDDALSFAEGGGNGPNDTNLVVTRRDDLAAVGYDYAYRIVYPSVGSDYNSTPITITGPFTDPAAGATTLAGGTDPAWDASGWTFRRSGSGTLLAVICKGPLYDATNGTFGGVTGVTWYDVDGNALPSDAGYSTNTPVRAVGIPWTPDPGAYVLELRVRRAADLATWGWAAPGDARTWQEVVDGGYNNLFDGNSWWEWAQDLKPPPWCSPLDDETVVLGSIPNFTIPYVTS